MNFIPTGFEKAFLIELTPHSDSRGMFARTFCSKEFETIGFQQPFQQMNQSWNEKKGTLRGMHFQHAPYTETKLVRCIKGSIWDVIVDLRRGSSTFLKSFGTELSAENKKMLLVPEGFAHGFLTLQDHSELIYHHTGFYTPGADAGIRCDDPLLDIQWPQHIAMISDKDKSYPSLALDYQGLAL